MGVIAISETIGSLGDEIGREAARVLGYDFADREIIAKAAERFGESLAELTHVTEDRPGLWERVTDTRRRYPTSVEAILFEMAARDNVVLLGRGATIVLAKVPHVLRARGRAPERLRVQRVEHQQRLSHEKAIDLVRHTDRERGSRIKFLYHVNWADSWLYDIVLNTERVTVERSVRILEDMMGDPRFAPTEASRREAVDLSIVAQAKAALLVDPRTRLLHLFPISKDGYVSISGFVDHDEQRKAAQDIVGTIPGVVGVLNEVVVRPARAIVSPGIP